MRTSRLLVALLALALLPALTVRASWGGGASAPLLQTDGDTLRANDGTSWSVPFRIENPLAAGFYTDSVRLVVTDLDRGETRLPRTTTLRLDALAKLMDPVEGGSTHAYECSVPGTCEHARLTLTVDGHDAGGTRHQLVKSVIMNGGPLTDAYPSQLVRVAGRTVELVPVVADGDGPRPGVLLVHDHGSHARLQLHTAQLLARRGWNVMLVSQPGYGQSTGPADLMGPATLGAMRSALAALKALPGTDSTRVAAWGIGRGATAVLLLAAGAPELKTVVAQSATYDLWSTYRHAPAEYGRGVIAEAGRDSAAWRARSPLLAAARVRANVLLLHGAKDDVAPVEDARAMDRALTANGATVERTESPLAGHVLNPRDGARRAIDYLAHQLEPR